MVSKEVDISNKMKREQEALYNIALNEALNRVRFTEKNILENKYCENIRQIAWAELNILDKYFGNIRHYSSSSAQMTKKTI